MTSDAHTTEIGSPDSDEYEPYYEAYVRNVGRSPVLTILERQREETFTLVTSLDEADSLNRYAPGKWTVKEVIGHLVDVERIFTCRALWFARGQEVHLPDMDADSFIREGEFDRRSLPDLAGDYDAARRSTIAFFRGLGASELARRGTAAGCEFTVRAIAHILAGHERHHLEILRKRYGIPKLS
jgi:uncharacterized damage-inducible protein DinB